MVALVSALAGCSGKKQPEAAVPSPTPSPTPVYTSPLSGLPATPDAPVVVVKIDNSQASHPQQGLNDADVVYMEQVEGGITRLAAVYSTKLPAQVGPVRSARESDIELLGAYGAVPLAFSGANKGVVGLINASILKNSSYDAIIPAYKRVSGRRAPYDLFTSPSAIAAERPNGAKAHDVGLVFGDVFGGQLVEQFTTKVAISKVTFVYDSPSKKWALSMDNKPSLTTEGGPVAADNVIVQSVRVRGSRYSDVNGNVSPYTISLGQGPAIIFRDGRRFNATWKRPNEASTTRFIGGNGKDVPLKPGTTWILLAGLNAPLDVTEAPDPSKSSVVASPAS